MSKSASGYEIARAAAGAAADAALEAWATELRKREALQRQGQTHETLSPPRLQSPSRRQRPIGIFGSPPPLSPTLPFLTCTATWQRAFYGRTYPRLPHP